MMFRIDARVALIVTSPISVRSPETHLVDERGRFPGLSISCGATGLSGRHGLRTLSRNYAPGVWFEPREGMGQSVPKMGDFQ